MDLRVAAGSLCSGASQIICAPKASATISPVSLRENFARHLHAGGEEQPVAMGAVVLPFLVGAKIGDRGFDLDDPDFAARIERHQIGSTAGRQRQFAHHAKAERMQQPRGAARDGERGFRLAAVDGKFQRLFGGDVHGAILSRFPARSGNAAASASRLASITPRSVISPVTSRAGVTSKP